MAYKWGWNPNHLLSKSWEPILQAIPIFKFRGYDRWGYGAFGWISMASSLTWNLKMMVSKRNLLFQGAIFRFHVKLWEANFSNSWTIHFRSQLNSLQTLKMFEVSEPRFCNLVYPLFFLGSWVTNRDLRSKNHPKILPSSEAPSTFHKPPPWPTPLQKGSV